MQNELHQKSDETWKVAVNCRDAGHTCSAANRLYYSVFQSVKAYAVQTRSMRMDEDQAVHTKTAEIVSLRRLGRLYTKFIEIRELRKRADYLPEEVDPAELENLFEPANELRTHFKKATPTNP